jgi:citrate synthase
MTPAAAAPRFDGELLSADEAARRLGVRKATLYAYVSRGLLCAVPDPQGSRGSRYTAFEVDRLRQAARDRRGPPAETPATLYDGLTLVDTTLTGVVDGDIVVCGQPLVAWSKKATLEETAALLWGVPVDAAFGSPPPELPEVWHDTAAALRSADPASRSVALWGLAMPHLHGGADLQGPALALALGRHLRVGFACVLGQPPGDAPLHAQMAAAWQLPADEADALRQALVLCADIMLNLAGLAGRMVASVQGSLAACLLASLNYGFIRLSGGDSAPQAARRRPRPAAAPASLKS